jgi:hypothetical protein
MDYDTTVLLLLIIGRLSVINLLLLGIVIILIDEIVQWKTVTVEVPVRRYSSHDTSRDY